MMREQAATQRRGQDEVDADTIRVGKDVIEILTTGMYVSPVTIYREYVQNAADSIDAARAQGLVNAQQAGSVDITFDHPARSVMIRDNGAGLRGRDVVATLVAIGGSAKRGTRARGFRGVGRLSGLAYCRELEFRTKAADESSVVSVTWDCRRLREKLADSTSARDLRGVVADAVSVWREPADDRADHFFEVRLQGITRLRNDALLNEKMVGHYLAQVAPLPFSPDFSFASSIRERLSRHQQFLPLEVTVGNEKLYRPYRDEIVLPGSSQELRIEEVEFLEFPDVDGQTAAMGWIAHHDYIRSLPSGLGIRGLRARVGDMQIGDANLFDDSFREPRFNGWSVGETHIFDQRIVPNGRRDNFETNHHYYNLLVQLGPVAAKIAQRCRSASVSRNAAQIARNVIAEAEDRLRQKRRFDRAELSRLTSAVLRAQARLKRVVDSKIRRSLERKLERLRKTLATQAPKRGASVVALDEAASLVAKFVSNREQARKLVQELRRLCE